MSTVTILGGAGFIASRIAVQCVAAGYSVTVVDGLLSATGGRRENLAAIESRIVFHHTSVSHFAGLADLLSGSDFIIDAMGWTCHRLALQNPGYDAQLNLAAHLEWLQCFRPRPGQLVLYLASRGQYGRTSESRITEDTPMVPVDIQGIHKLAAEHYFRYYSDALNFPAISLRISNCIGPNQPVSGPDIGLAGGFIRDLLTGRNIEIFGDSRRRPVVFVDDIASVTVRLLGAGLTGFTALNAPAQDVEIEEMVATLIQIIGTGSYTKRPLTGEVARIDGGNALFDSSKLTGIIGPVELTPLRESLDAAVQYFQRRLKEEDDLALRSDTAVPGV
jgi:UDP-glucose 4-epimerase